MEYSNFGLRSGVVKIKIERKYKKHLFEAVSKDGLSALPDLGKELFIACSDAEEPIKDLNLKPYEINERIRVAAVKLLQHLQSLAEADVKTPHKIEIKMLASASLSSIDGYNMLHNLESGSEYLRARKEFFDNRKDGDPFTDIY